MKGATLRSSKIGVTAHISIHAPVKGATLLFVAVTKDPTISIHAPVKGATAIFSFQAMAFGISIHAPVKGATSAASLSVSILHDFNPRTREGCDCRSASFASKMYGFQSTHP